MSIFILFKDGRKYLETWPLEAKLGIIFPENRIIRATKFAQKTMPVMAVFAVCWQYFYGYGVQSIASAGLTAIFALCLPLHGLYWLGKRANTPLSSQSAVWFYKIFEQLQSQNVPLLPIDGKPTYQNLAEVLKLAQQKFQPEFWQDV